MVTPTDMECVHAIIDSRKIETGEMNDGKDMTGIIAASPDGCRREGGALCLIYSSDS